MWHVVDDLRGLGWPAERVLIAMKAMAAEAGLKPSAHPMTGDDSIDARDAMLGKVISWCIQRYYVDAEKRSENSSD